MSMSMTELLLIFAVVVLLAVWLILQGRESPGLRGLGVTILVVLLLLTYVAFGRAIHDVLGIPTPWTEESASD